MVAIQFDNKSLVEFTPNRETAPFDRIARLAALLFAVPIGLLGFLHAGRLVFEGRFGLDITDIPADLLRIVGDAPFVLEDSGATELQHFVSALGAPTIRFLVGVPVRGSAGELLGLLCVLDYGVKDPEPTEFEGLMDLADLARSEIEAVKALERFRMIGGHVSALIELGSDVVWESDTAGGLYFGGFGNVTQNQEHLALTLKVFDGVQSPADLQRLSGNHPGVVRMVQYLDLHQPFRKLSIAIPWGDQQKRWFEVSGQPQIGTTGSFIGFHGLLSEVTSQKRLFDLVLQIAETDLLTGILNRQAGQRRLVESILSAESTGEKLALLVLDIDDFGTINASLGNDAGDVVLRELTRRLLTFKTLGHDVSRLGADEFGLLLRGPTADPAAAPAAIAVLAKSLACPFSIADREVHLRISMGVACYPSDAQDPVVLSQYAFLALEAAKRSRLYRDEAPTFFHPELAEQEVQDKFLEADIRRGIEADEFEVFLQPITQTKDLSILGFEALLRWRHPQKGLLGPDSFLAVAATTGLTVPLGQIALRLAAETLGRWRRSGLTVGFIAVNVAMAQFFASDLVNDLVTAVVDNGIEPCDIKIEVTEQVFLSETSASDVGKVLSALRDHGVSIDLDDFGTGYACLIHLRHFPVTGIKVDRSFINGVPRDFDDGEIVMALLALGRNLNLSVVAEGVETEEQRAFLEHLGCAAIQGYLVAKPMSISAATTFLVDRSRSVTPPTGCVDSW